MNTVTKVCLIVVGIIHILPLAGVIGMSQLEELYGIKPSDVNVQLLLQHRAVLFGLLGGFVLASAFRHKWKNTSFVAATVSVLSFLLLAFAIDNLNPHLHRVVMIDFFALLVIVVGYVADCWVNRDS